MKKTVLAFLLAAALATLCACGETPKTLTNPDVSQGTEDVLPIQNSQQPQTIHMSETLCDGLAIDADIPVHEGLALPTYQANYFRIPVADAVSLLGGGSKVKSEEPHHYDPNGFTLVLESGAQIFHANGILTYCSETGERDREISDLLSRYGETHSEEEVHSLSFMSPDEAISKASALISELDMIGEPALDAIVGLTGTEIMAWQNELMTDESYSWWADIGKTVVLDDLTAEDDAYYISFYFTYQNIPVFDQEREPGISSASDSFPTSSMKADVLITPKGVRYFSVQNALGTEGSLSEAQSIISVQEALEKLCEEQENTITFGTQLIVKVWLEYIPIRAENAVDGVGPFILKPYWCFGTVDAESGGDRIINADRINAVTGDDLAYEQ
jgi:predicted small lipoprotein YifL